MAAYEDSLGRVNGAVVEFVTGIAVVKTFGRASEAHERYTAETENFADLFYNWVKDLLRLANVTDLVLSPLFAVIWVLGGSTAFEGAGVVQPVEVLPFLLLGAAVTSPIKRSRTCRERTAGRRRLGQAGRRSARYPGAGAGRAGTPPPGPCRHLRASELQL